MKRTILTTLTITLLAIASDASATNINVNFGTVTAPDGTTGAAPDASAIKRWNNLLSTLANGGSAPDIVNESLVDSDGNSTSVVLNFDTGTGNWDASANGSVTDQTILRGYAGGQEVLAHTASFTGLNDSATYDLYVYSAWNFATNVGMDTTYDLTVGTYSGSDPVVINNNNNQSTFVLASAANEARSDENYFVFSGIAPVSGEIEFTVASPNGGTGAFQLVEFSSSVPEPESIILAVLGFAIGLAIIRRRK